MVTKQIDIRVWPGVHSSPMDPFEPQLMEAEKLEKRQLTGSLLISTDNINIIFSPLTTSSPVTLSSMPLQAVLPMDCYHIIINNWNPSAGSISSAIAFNHHFQLSSCPPVLQFQQFFTTQNLKAFYPINFSLSFLPHFPFPSTTC